MSKLIAHEEEWWGQRSRAIWLAEGDKNMKFFHHKASQRRDRNWIERLQDDNGFWYHEDEDIARVLSESYQDLFSADDLVGTDDIVGVVKGRISDDQKRILEPAFTREQVSQALKQMHPTKAPGLDGHPALFYQKFWHIIGDEVTDLVISILNNDTDV